MSPTKKVKAKARVYKKRLPGGRMIVKGRDDLGVSQTWLSSKTDVSQGYLSNLENAQVDTPSAKHLLNIAWVLKLDLIKLFEAWGLPTDSVESVFGQEDEKIPVDSFLLEFLSAKNKEWQRRLLHFLEGYGTEPR